MSHLASRLLAEVVARLSVIAPVNFTALHSVSISDQPTILIEDIADETVDQMEEFEGPINETHELRFSVFALGTKTTPLALIEEAGELRQSIELSLLGTDAGRRLSGLCRSGLTRSSAELRIDSESLQRPVGGWLMRFSCRYATNTGAPQTN